MLVLAVVMQMQIKSPLKCAQGIAKNTLEKNASNIPYNLFYALKTLST